MSMGLLLRFLVIDIVDQYGVIVWKFAKDAIRSQ